MEGNPIMKYIELNWQDFKTQLSIRNLLIQYIEQNNDYTIWAKDFGGFPIFYTSIAIQDPTIVGSDQEDFENNYKIASNAPTDPTIINNQGVMRMAVDANFSGGVAFEAYTPHIGYNSVYTSIGSSDVELFSFTGRGKLDFFTILANNDNYEVILKIDGNEEFRITMHDLGDHLDLDDKKSNLPLWVESGNKKFRWNDIMGSDFTVSFKILVRRTSGTNTKARWLVKYRGKI